MKPVRKPDLPVHAPMARGAAETAYARQALGRREARRLGTLMDDAEARARAVMATAVDNARREIDDIFAAARNEAEAILARLPDYDALDSVATGKGGMRRSAHAVIRAVADRHGLSMAIVKGKIRSDRAIAARGDAVRAVAAEFPDMDMDAIGALFDLSGAHVRKLVMRGEG